MIVMYDTNYIKFCVDHVALITRDAGNSRHGSWYQGMCVQPISPNSRGGIYVEANTMSGILKLRNYTRSAVVLSSRLKLW